MLVAVGGELDAFEAVHQGEQVIDVTHGPVGVASFVDLCSLQVLAVLAEQLGEGFASERHAEVFGVDC